jgi:hypothetical protein
LYQIDEQQRMSALVSRRRRTMQWKLFKSAGATETIFFEAATMFSNVRKIFFVTQKIFYVSPTIFFTIEKMVWIAATIFPVA